MIYFGTLPTFPCHAPRDKGGVDKLPVGSEDKGVLITHPGVEFIAPALLLDWIPLVTVSTGSVLSALDHKHRSHHLSQGLASLLPSTSANL